MLRYLLIVSLFPIVAFATIPNDALVTLTKSGNDFLRTCEPRGELSSTVEAVCSGYANGVIDGYDYAFATVQAKSHDKIVGAFCPPDDITRGQQYRIAMKYLDDHPEKTHRVVSALIAESMQAAFPCPTRSPDVNRSK